MGNRKLQLSGKGAAVERNRLKFGPQGVYAHCIQGTFDS